MNLFYDTKPNCKVLSRAKAQISLQAPRFQNILQEGNNLTEVSKGSCSDSSSAGSNVRSMSISDRTVRDERLSHKTDRNKPFTSTCGHEIPRSCTRLTGTLCNHSSVIDTQCDDEQRYNSFPAPLPGCVSMLLFPIPVHVLPMTISQPHSSQSVLGCYPMKQNQTQGIQQNMTTLNLTDRFPCMMQPSRFSRFNNYDMLELPQIVGSSYLNTPVVNYFGGQPKYFHSNSNFEAAVFPTVSSNQLLKTRKYPDAEPNLEIESNVLQDHFFLEQNSSSMKQFLSSSEHLPVRAIAINKYTSLSSASIEPTADPSSTYIETLLNNREKYERSLRGTRKGDEDLWPGSCTYIVNKENKGSSLFATWSRSSSELVNKFNLHNFKVNHVNRTSDDQVHHIVFENHASARKAFTMQCEMHLRLVPPKKSPFKWLRNPSPSFLVMYETIRPLIVRKGKAQSHDIVGELLISKGIKQKGCLVWADQLKRDRIRVLMCRGNLRLPGGRIVHMKGLSNSKVLDISVQGTSLGWISYRSRFSKEMFVIRRSGNLLSDYIYRG